MVELLSCSFTQRTGKCDRPFVPSYEKVLYKAVLDEHGKLAGFVGSAIYTEGLVRMLDSLSLNGMKSAQYYMADAEKGEYIFHPQEEKVAGAV